jgi:hypothetical protein
MATVAQPRCVTASGCAIRYQCKRGMAPKITAEAKMQFRKVSDCVHDGTTDVITATARILPTTVK